MLFNTEENAPFSNFTVFLITSEVSNTSSNSQKIADVPSPNTVYSVVVNSDDYKYIGFWLSESSNVYGKNLKVLYKGNNDIHNLADKVKIDNVKLFKETSNNKSFTNFKGNDGGFLYIPISPYRFLLDFFNYDINNIAHL